MAGDAKPAAVRPSVARAGQHALLGASAAVHLPKRRSRSGVRVRCDAQGSACAPDRRRLLLCGLPSLCLWGAASAATAVELAPLGKVERLGGEKRNGISIEELKDVLAADLGERQYFVTGNLTPEVFADDCRFTDPTNDTVGLNRYVKALDLLFDDKRSSVTLKSIKVSSPTTIEAQFTLAGYLKFPWNPRIPPVDGTVTYTTNENGIIKLQDQVWSISSLDAIAQSFTPTAGTQ
ncbi:unnamed protein product [Ostreobium quekettii]|uniref:Uncharacterized protein n=1 Tax=Ostreobium quekettii TaxID=121088 RepID=A0A8S1JEZ0_9CHLO|nr:unnamed protein product [Ostreobium quekettii]|eukprot:evm.model.scf_534.5 EVM.evm.TU.scf_534.5   scf_534:33933-36220(-)